MINCKNVVYESKGFKVHCGEDVFNKIITIKGIDYEQENFIVFFLDVKNEIIKEEVLFKGGISACLVCTNTIFKKALINNSDKIIIAHNHPSSNLDPSDEDILIFKKLREIGEILNICVLDSIIFNKEGFYSQIDLER